MKVRLVPILMLLCALFAASEVHAQCADWEIGPLDNGAGPNGANGNIYATLSWDPDDAGPLLARLVVGGEFTSIGGVAATNIAQWAPETGQWQPFGGVIGQVNALELFNGQIVAGCSGDNNVGTFDLTVRRWDGANWIPMAATNTGSVTCMVVHNGTLFVGGSFITQFVVQGSNPAHYIARWNPVANLWEDVDEAGFGTQTNTAVRALASYNNELCVGGWTHDSSTVTGSKKYLTRGNVPSAFTPVTTDAESGSIMALNVFAGELLIGGGFGTFNGVTCNSIAAWNGSGVHGFSTGIGPFPGQGALVTSITIHNGIMVGGEFATAGGVTVNRVAFWPPGGFAWQALGGGTNARVWDMVSYRGSLVVGGEFTYADRPANHLAYWDGAAWGAFGGGSGSYVLAMTSYAGRMVAGGVFHQSTAALSTAHNIAGWNGGTAQAFGTGMNGAVQALKAFKYPGFQGSNELIAGGAFTVAGGLASNYIARWNERPNVAFPPPAWEPMGAGFNSYVYAVERSNGVTYAGGAFTASGATSVPYIAQWNETSDTWGPVGFGMNGFVYALKEYNGSLYAGGNFSVAGGSLTGGLARWSGLGWVSVGGSFLDAVFALEVHDGKLVIGGQFSAFPGNPNIIQYDGVSFSAFGSGGANNNVRSLKSHGTHLYVGGDFTTIGGLPVNRIAYWDGLWHDLQYGTDSAVYALGSYQNEIHVGGAFTNVDYNGIATPLLSPFWARYTETGLPWFVQYPFSKTAQLGDDVVFAAQVASGFTVTYQWYHNDVALVDGPTGNGSTIGGATAATLQISDAVWTDHGSYHVVATNSCGSVETFPVSLEFTGVTAAPPPGFTGTTVFEALGPNPAGASSQVAFSLAHDAAVRVRIHDVRGRLVRALEVGRLPAGRHTTSWDARDNQGQRVAAGAYLVRLEVDGQPIGSKRLTILH